MLKIIALLFFIGGFNLEAKIITTDKIEDIETEFTETDDQTLVCLDCDHVLIELHDSIFQSQNEKICKAIINEGINFVKKTSRKAMSKRDIYTSFGGIVYHDAKFDLLSDEWLSLISALQSSGVKVILLSACETGRLSVIKSVPKWRYGQLTQLGIDFKKSWNDLEQITFFEFGNNGKGYPVFYNGMLLSVAVAKGSVLKAFLLKIPQYKFKKIIFIDDKMENVKSVEEVANDLGIKYVGIEYTYAKTKKRIPLNLERAKKQFKILVKEHRWVSDEKMEAQYFQELCTNLQPPYKKILDLFRNR